MATAVRQCAFARLQSEIFQCKCRRTAEPQNLERIPDLQELQVTTESRKSILIRGGIYAHPVGFRWQHPSCKQSRPRYYVANVTEVLPGEGVWESPRCADP